MKKNIDDILNNISIEEINGIIEDLKSVSLENSSYEMIEEKVQQLMKCGFMTVTFPKGKIIYRGREWDSSKTVFKNSSEISYPPLSDYVADLSLNRASSNKFQIFYGAVGTPDFSKAEVISMIEICNITQSNFNNDDEYIVIGQWEVIKDFTVVSLGLHSEIAKKNQQAQEMLKFHSDVSTYLSDRGIIVNSVAEFMSNEFSKEVNHGEGFNYSISAAYGDNLFNRGFKGIIFPSVKSEGTTFNIALEKDTVDNYLKLNVAAIARIQKIEGEFIIDWFLKSTNIIDNNLKWEDPGTSLINENDKKRIINSIKINRLNNLK